MNKDSPNQIFEYILSNNTKSRLNSFLNIFDSISNIDMKEIIYKLITAYQNKDIYFIKSIYKIYNGRGRFF